MPPTDNTYHTVPDLAGALGVNATKVLGWIARGELVAVDVSARRGERPRWRIAAAELERFLQARRAVPVVPAPRQTRRKRDYTEYV